jgi:hypothetical protein
MAATDEAARPSYDCRRRSLPRQEGGIIRTGILRMVFGL